MDWLRLHHGTASDPKWRVVAIDSGQPVHAVLSVWVAMLECASQASPRGELVGWSDRVTAAALDLSADAVKAIREAMQTLVLDGVKLRGWEKRQPKREDGSAERVRDFRERQRNADERTVTQRNAPTADVTSRAPAPTQEQNRTDQIRKEIPPKPPEGAGTGDHPRFAEFWEAYPSRGTATNPRKPAAERFAKLAARGQDVEAMIAGARGYAVALRQADKLGTDKVMQAITFLNQAGWEQYASTPREKSPQDIRLSDLRARASTIKSGSQFARDAAQRYPRPDIEEMVRLGYVTVADLQKVGIQIAPRAVG